MQTFTDFKKDFYSRVKDLTIFDCEDFNLLKVVLDGLRVKYNPKNIGKDFFLSPTLYNVKYRIKEYKRKPHLFNKKLEPYKNKYLIGFNERFYTPLEPNKSIYFENIFNALGKENFFYVGEENKNSAVDMYLQDLIINYSNYTINDREVVLLLNLQKVFKRIKKSKIFDAKELEKIACAFEVFFIHFKSWNKILKIITPKSALFCQHYHREGFILACKENNIKTIELQHGLIVPEDIFYIFPEATKYITEKALFADEILVYGNYWKANLLKGYEYPINKIKILGYYHYEPKNNFIDKNINDFILDHNIVLITTQTNLTEKYIEYVKKLIQLIKEKNYQWKIIIKPHPSENIELYKNAINTDSCLIANMPLNYLFNIATIHISIYSTTMYDALRYNVTNYTLFDDDYGDYCQRLVTDGVAKLITKNDDPIKVHLADPKQKTDKGHNYYSPFDINVLTQTLSK